MHIYRWDLDRTYLDTDIHSVRGMLRSALETAADKRTMPGADVLLRSLTTHDPTARVAIVSGSPTQMRAVLEEKLARDGVRVDSFVLKDNLRNITRGRFRAVRGQLGYKLPQLLAQRLSEEPSTTESLFGDDAEVDALVYALYADAIAGRVDATTLERILRAGDAYDDQIDHALRSLSHLHTRDAVEDIWIHVDRGMPRAAFQLLGGPVHVVYSWLQAALGLWARGRLDAAAVAAVARRVDSDRGHGPRGLAALVQDAVRRGLLPHDLARDAFVDDPDLQAARRYTLLALDQLGSTRFDRAHSAPPDYVAFLRAARGSGA